MSKHQRAIGSLIFVFAALLALYVWWPQRGNVEQAVQAETYAEAEAPAAAEPAASHFSLPKFASLARPASAPLGGAAGSPAQAQCQSCRDRECSNFRGTGLDMVGGCLYRVDGSMGANVEDETFISECTAVLDCAARTGCAASKDGAAACYCGSRSLEECAEHGPSPDAPCAKQWQRATRSNNYAEVSERFSDPAYPSGWALQLLKCQKIQCPSECSRGS